MNSNAAAEEVREEKAAKYLVARGWRYVGRWKFRSPAGSVHDMSAADLSQADRIAAERLFLVYD